MKGIYTIKRKHGTAVYISYSPPGEPSRRRELGKEELWASSSTGD